MPKACWNNRDRSRRTLDEAIQRIDEISTLPKIALRVMEVANDPDSEAHDLKEVLESDAALAARVLRCVNSSAYGVRVRITNLQQAIAYLGLQQIRNLAITASVSELFRSNETIGPYRRRDLWRHLVSVGICARLVAMRRGLANFEDMFLAGLLHDVGIILEDQHEHYRFCTVIRSLSKDKMLVTVEQEKMGFDHTVLGDQIGATWGFPAPIKAAIRYHHSSTTYRGEDIELVRCVEVANMICSFKGITSVGVNLVKLTRAAFSGLSLTKEDFTVLAEDLDHELVLNAGLFRM